MIGPVKNSGPVEYHTCLPRGSVIVTDDTSSSYDLSLGTDFDTSDERELDIKWNLSNDGVSVYEIFVQVGSNSPVLLGRTDDASQSHFRWNEDNANVESPFSSGPQFGESYSFSVAGVPEIDSAPVVGPVSNLGPVEFEQK